ncbi:Ger(x)C family spore germination protein [Paenibacillus frigoriresistens]|uniref:Ger(x)C family spore germination protein n=1 Tax=Paenibacillus alginolyticus TaxID=59839 RepID=UPI00156302B3|nr:Ger(x)C family spore germination protein [Paenibacillus frigoriresistens]NRF93209.1 Ger(x)C family spore germination protein [Paenibacillus frigoriresistens]
MKCRQKISLILFLCIFVTTGCSDRTELNDLAIVLGSGMDQNQDGVFVGSVQIAIPANLGRSHGGGGKDKGYTLETATGKSILDALQNIQLKTSRKLFGSHRRVSFIGEHLARNGISKFLDEYSRNPDVRMRSDLFVVKGGTARNVLGIPYKPENIPALAALKIHQAAGGPATSSLTEFLIAASTEGSSPTLPVVEMVSSPSSKDNEGEENKTFRFTGRAIFNNDLKIIGFLNTKEALHRLWILGKLKTYFFTEDVPEENGNISLYVITFKSKIQPLIQGNKIKFDVSLTAKGTIQENNTNLDLKQANNLEVVERVLNKNLQKQILQTVTKVQKQYGTDIFGFGEAVHQKYPYKWKVLKKNWSNKFSEADVSVKVNLIIKTVGSTGPSLHLKESEIKK